ncbi:MAG: glycoside hydrolase family 3 N-terminal domain-containing protein [Bacteroidota bacterium]
MAYKGIFAIILVFIVLGFDDATVFSEGSAIEKNLVPNRIDPAYIELSSQWVDSVFDAMTLEEKIGQLIMIPAYSNRDEAHLTELKNLIQKHHIGGAIFFQGGPVRQAIMTNQLQEAADIPLMIAMDGEWGLAMRLDSTIKYPKQMTLGAIKDNQLIYQMGKDIAEQMERLGVHINFAPVVDVNNNPANPVIGSRSFGEDKMNVAQKGLAYMMGLQDSYILASAKHFPGHGDTDADSHYSLPVIAQDSLRLDSLELYPFKQLIRGGLGSVMVAHLHIPAFDPTPNLPSTLSKPMVTDILKEKLEFKGLVFTDALNMKGASKYFNPGALEVKALLAGNDVLLMPDNIPTTVSAIKTALKKNVLTQEMIDEKVKKILAVKYWFGLSNYRPVELSDLHSDLNHAKYELNYRRLVESAHTLAKNENQLLPLKRLDTLQIASVVIGETDNHSYQNTLDLYQKVAKFQLPKNFTVAQADEVIKQIQNYNLLIVSVHNTSMFASRQFGVTDKTIELIEYLANRKPLVLNLFSSPYVLNRFSESEKIPAILISYEEGEVFESTAAQAIFGGIPAQGILPVTASQQFRVNMADETFGRMRFKYSIPAEVGMDADKLLGIDSIVADAIKKEATPGCQVLVAKEGVVVYHKAFGHHTYLKKREVKLADLYDLASITKISATVPALMKLYEDKQIDLQAPLKTYLPELDTLDKGELILGDILTHQARLEPWIPFYLATLESLEPNESIYSNELNPSHPYMLARNIFMTKHLVYRDSVFDNDFSYRFPIKVADEVYMNQDYVDTIYHHIYTSELQKQKKYKYSDLGYFMFYRMIERITGEPFYPYLYKNFYKKLGAETLGFLPLNRYSRDEIVPTENDIIFRRQLLQGYVHDPGAAMLGGICGHAGLFSNANDLAKLMQMYLNGGIYGGTRFFRDETLEIFTSSPFVSNDNRRAYGFDKPRLASHKYGPACDDISPKSFGHSGFTGTMAWVDPDTDVVYIFLSNRIHPDANNSKLIEMDVRTKIQEVIYTSMIN